jgi:hypothetical protein
MAQVTVQSRTRITRLHLEVVERLMEGSEEVANEWGAEHRSAPMLPETGEAMLRAPLTFRLLQKFLMKLMCQS